VLDLGCGPADVCVRFARAFPRCRILGIDGSPAMLRQARIRLARHADVHDRIMLMEGVLPLPSWCRRFSTIISNSLLHHLPDPQVLWATLQTAGEPAARIFVVDLRRPDDEEKARRLTDQHAAGQPAVLQRDFHHSLLAAFTPEEVRDQLSLARLSHLNVRPLGDRHVMIWGRL
jgi:trans-aconitate methyltransferase